MTVDPTDTSTWPVVLTEDDIAAILRIDNNAVGERRRRVHGLVTDGVLTPIGGKPTGRLSNLRFSRRDVLALVGELEEAS